MPTNCLVGAEPSGWRFSDPAMKPPGGGDLNLGHGGDPDVHAIADNPLLDVSKQHWRTTSVRPSINGCMLPGGLDEAKPPVKAG